MDNEQILGRLISELERIGMRPYGRVKKIAEAAGYSRTHVSDLLSGKVPISYRIIEKICEKLGLSKSYIWDGLPDDGGSLNPFSVQLGADLESIRLRFYEVLDFRGIPAQERLEVVAEKTEYSVAAVSEILSGEKKIDDRFFQRFWRNFDINPEWLATGVGEISFSENIDRVMRPPNTGNISRDIKAAFRSLIIKEVVYDLSQMTDSEFHRALAAIEKIKEDRDSK